MPIVIADRVKVTTTTTGTGTLTLGAAATGFQDFGVIGDGNETYYTISVPGGADFEVGIGTFTAAGTTLSRDTILASSNGGLAVNLSAGTKDVFVTYPSGRSVVSYDGNNSEFPPSTRMLFGQTTAPTGWTKDTTNFNNHALRVVTGTASTGGTVDFTVAFASQTPTGTVTVTANTGQIAQAGNISVSTGQAAAPGSSGPTAAPIGQAAAPGSVGPTAAPIGTTAAPIGQAAGPVSVGDTTLTTAQIPAHGHNFTIYNPGGQALPFGVPYRITQVNVPVNNIINSSLTGSNQAHSHPGSGGQHVHPSPAHGHPSPAHTHPFTGGQHAHPSPAHTHPFTGGQHAHPASGTFTGSQHAHPVSAPASFSGSAINLAVKYLDVITATKD